MSDDALDKITELMKPIDEQITICENSNEQVMLACGMMQRVKEILEHHLGNEGATKILKEYVNNKTAH